MVKLPVRHVEPSYVRNFIFGVEDSLVSTVGLLSGVAIANVPERTILLAGIVLICVEAFSMATGSFLSESGAAEYKAKGAVSARKPAIDALIMFFSYFVAGFVPLLPYMVLPVRTAFIVSLIATLAALMVLGIIGAKLSHTKQLRNGLKTAVIGGIAVVLGVIVGRLFSV